MLEIWPPAISPSSGQTKTSLLESWNPRKFVWKELRDLAYDLVGYFVVLLGPIMTVKKKNLNMEASKTFMEASGHSKTWKCIYCASSQSPE